MVLNPKRLAQVVSQLANAVQTIAIVSGRLKADLGARAQDAEHMHAAALLATAALRQLQPNQPSDSERR